MTQEKAQFSPYKFFRLLSTAVDQGIGGLIKDLAKEAQAVCEGIAENSQTPAVTKQLEAEIRKTINQYPTLKDVEVETQRENQQQVLEEIVEQSRTMRERESELVKEENNV